MAVRHVVAVFVVTAGLHDSGLGSDEQETVLFTWLVVNIWNSQVVAVKQTVIRPRCLDVNENLLSDACREEFGLTEEQVKSGEPLENALEELDQYVRSHLDQDDSSSFHLITDGQLHLRQVLHAEAARKGIALPDYYFSFFDLRKEFLKFYRCEDCASIQEMMNYIGLENEGDQNYATRQVQNMAKIILRLVGDGHKFEEPELINSRLEPGICTKNEIVDNSTVVRVRGLPWQSSDQDIAMFFRGLNIVRGGVALCLSPQGRRNGEALVRFVNSEHRDMALKRHRHHIGQRYVEVYRAMGEDFVNVAGGCNNEAQAFLSRGAQTIIRMRGLPYDCTPKQVIDFFANSDSCCQVMDNEEGILFVRKPDGRATGDAFVLFDSEEVALKALKKHRELIGSRYIELFRSTTAEVQQVLNRSLDPRTYDHHQPLISNIPQVPMVSQHLLPAGSRKDCIRLRGLPYEAQVEHILEFFGEHAKNIVFQGVHMVFNAQGQPSGEAFIQMDSEQSAFNVAQQRHHRYMVFGKKQRYIEVFQCSVDDMNLYLTGGIPLQRPMFPPGGTVLPLTYGAYPYVQSPQVLPPPTPLTPRVPTYYTPIFYWPYPSPPVSPTAYYAPSGHTMVIMRGLPYNATMVDIISFFQGVAELTPDCIQFQRNVDGRPNGEALVTFPTRHDAERAIQEKNRHNIGNRYIELFMA